QARGYGLLDGFAAAEHEAGCELDPLAGQRLFEKLAGHGARLAHDESLPFQLAHIDRVPLAPFMSPWHQHQDALLDQRRAEEIRVWLGHGGNRKIDAVVQRQIEKVLRILEPYIHLDAGVAGHELLQDRHDDVRGADADRKVSEAQVATIFNASI